MAQWIQNIKSQGKIFYSINDLSDIKPSYMKGGPWIKSFGFSNSLCARATRAITNHAPIGEYQLCFFPREEFSCPCGLYPIKTRCHTKQDVTSFTTVEDSTMESGKRNSLPIHILFGIQPEWACNIVAAIALYIYII